MSQQYKKVVKRRRRKAYLQRRKERIKAEASQKKTARSE